MGIVKKIYRKIREIFYSYFILIKTFVLSKINKKRMFLFGIPVHGNLGDQAILYAEKKFLKDKYPEYIIIEIESSVAVKFIDLFYKIIKSNDLILVHGGGFLGTIWMNEEEMFRTVITKFNKNKIIVFPQTIYFSKDDNGKKILEESKKIYYSHKNLYICCREKYSYEFMQKELPECKVLLIPDIVLYLPCVKNEMNLRKNALFCIRKDKEKVQYNFDEIINFLNDNKLKIDYTDTVISKKIYNFNRYKEIEKKFKQFSNYKIVITDRLHGMVFAYLTKTPCLVFENSSYKVKGLYEWIKKSTYIKLYNSSTLKKDLEDLISFKCDNKENNVEGNFIELKELIDNKLKESI